MRGYHDRGLDRIKNTICTQYRIKKSVSKRQLQAPRAFSRAPPVSQSGTRTPLRALAVTPSDQHARPVQWHAHITERSRCSHHTVRVASGCAIAAGICMAPARSRSAAPNGNSAATGRFWGSKRLEARGTVSEVSGVAPSFRLPVSKHEAPYEKDRRIGAHRQLAHLLSRVRLVICLGSASSRDRSREPSPQRQLLLAASRTNQGRRGTASRHPTPWLATGASCASRGTRPCTHFWYSA